MRKLIFRLLTLSSVVALSACSALPTDKHPMHASKPVAAEVLSSRKDLIDLPAPTAPIVVAVYGVADQTGQFKTTDGEQTLSRALSQGATSILIQSLRDAGKGKWFTVVERENLTNLLKERQIVTEMRQRYLGEGAVDPNVLPSMLFAGVLIEGGVVGYDSNVRTGGAGARLLGIGGSTEYRQDTITVYLRAVATKTGEVLSSVVTRKMVLSIGVQGGAFRYISYKNLLELEGGVTVNEPRTIALEQAVQKAAHDLILDAAHQGVWSMADKSAGDAVMQKFLSERADNPAAPVADAKLPQRRKSVARAAPRIEPLPLEGSSGAVARLARTSASSGR